MIPKRVVLENFLSFGPRTEIEFTDDEPLWVVGGPNGVGKSAVFDAITFCLFGAHRGGAKEIDPLIRHGANGFSVAFEFEFGGIDYRITRNRVGNKTTQAVELRKPDAGKWDRVPNINSVPQVREWAEKTLGLGFDAFKASVLLRQGEADAIITAGGTERLKILKKIIGAERFEELSKRVHDAARAKAAELERLTKLRENTSSVTADQLEAAGSAVQAAEGDRALADTGRQDATERVGLAKTFAQREKTRRELVDKIAAADTRAAAKESIRKDKERLDELNQLLPMLAVQVPLKKSVAELEDILTEARRINAASAAKQEELSKRCEGLRLRIAGHRATAADHAKEATELRTDAEQQSRFLTAAEQVAELARRLQEFPSHLDQLATEAEKDNTDAGTAERAANDDVTEADTLLKQARKEQKQFEAVEIGVKCSRCGQEVTAEHAAKERARIAGTITTLTRQQLDAATKAAEAKKTLNDAKAQKAQFDRQITDRNTTSQRLEDHRRNLEALGGISDVARLGEAIREMNARAVDFEKQRDAARDAQAIAEGDLGRAEADLGAARVDCKKQADELARLNDRHVADSAKLESLSAQLPEPWRDTTAEQLAARTAEYDQLKSSGINERFRQLADDAARRDEWVQQLLTAQIEIESIPESARIPVGEAERLEGEARSAFVAADKQWQEARDAHTELVRKAGEFNQLKKQIEMAEAEARIHGTLDDHLGRTGLQRELVRDAETQIVGYAQAILHNLSGGDLSVELDRSAQSDDEALVLQVRRSDDPTPIGVAYLSGSQKFRVAISVALAIGRFAAGQARPLECVIIDEGFGSLDKDGLKSAAEELNRLKQFLRRIVLVSHQEEFTENFPVVIRLNKSENGTTAEKVRR